MTEQNKKDSGLEALVLCASYWRIQADPAQLRHELGLMHEAATALQIVEGAQSLGLKARALFSASASRLRRTPLPCLAQLNNGSFVLLGNRHEGDRLRVINPTERSASIVDLSSFLKDWEGTIIQLVAREKTEFGPNSFDLSWFVPFLSKYRFELINVVLVSFFIQICALITPLLFQIIIDKVLVHKGYSTLYMVGAAFFLVAIFQGLLQMSRTYVLNHTTSKIDVELGASLFGRLMQLPMLYFETRAAGQTAARMREVENIRSFLTGQGLTSILDLLFTSIFLVALFAYSAKLTLVVLISIPVYFGLGWSIRPLLRHSTKIKFEKGAASNQFLIETIIGSQTVKALALEPTMRKLWETRLASYVASALNCVNIASVGQNLIQLVSRFTTAAILVIGAHLVIQGDLSVGALVAFNMLVSQTTLPIMRLSQLWQDFQQVKISVDRLGDIMNFPPEASGGGLANLPSLQGKVEFKDVGFRYRFDGPKVLQGLSFFIEPGEVIGIVGPSGSGKSTITRLVQKLYSPEEGQILIDGIDISHIDPAWLRRSIGVVLQESFLFNRSIHDNIAIGAPGMTRAQVIVMAKLAGADEFVSRLPAGYDMMVEERGANLSGGQRQRIAIARALASNPRLLIFDEATSALDYESEKIIQENMRGIVRGRTVIIVAHRLAAVRDCNRIFTIENGRLSEAGTHQELLQLPFGRYKALHDIQAT